MGNILVARSSCKRCGKEGVRGDRCRTCVKARWDDTVCQECNGGKAVSKGLCGTCYQRQRRGKLLITPFINLTQWLGSLGLPSSQEGQTVCVGNFKVTYLDLNSVTKDTRLPEIDTQTVILFSDEWMERTEKCKDILLSKLGVYQERVGARKCDLAEISTDQARAFIKATHIQGSNNLTIAGWGLFRDKEIVGVMTLGRHNRQGAGNAIVLDRMCFKPGVQIVGGASRLLKAATAWALDHKYNKILSFSDDRWHKGGVYEKMGFDLEYVGKPDYFYVKDGKRLSKQSQAKKVSKCPSDLTEFQWATKRGLFRVYDCGKKRWAINLEVK